MLTDAEYKELDDVLEERGFPPITDDDVEGLLLDIIEDDATYTPAEGDRALVNYDNAVNSFVEIIEFFGDTPQEIPRVLTLYAAVRPEVAPGVATYGEPESLPFKATLVRSESYAVEVTAFGQNIKLWFTQAHYEVEAA